MSGFSLSSEPFTLVRDCDAVMVPQGEQVTLPAGQIGYITLGMSVVPMVVTPCGFHPLSKISPRRTPRPIPRA